MFQSFVLPVLLVTAIGLLAGVILVIAAKFMAVEVDERLTAVRDILPGANCGACGFAGCDDYAAKLVNDGVATNLCTPGGSEVSRKISETLGVEFADVVEMYGIVRCSGDCDATHYIMDYTSRPTCAAANIFFQGRGTCSYACSGYGDCIEACQYDAIHIVNGVAVIDKQRCSGCGMCAKRCPNHLITMIPTTSHVFVGCHSTDKGAMTRKICSHGCIGCKKCEKTCPEGAIVITENLAAIDPAKCTNCGACMAQCPTGVIKSCLEQMPQPQQPTTPAAEAPLASEQPVEVATETTSN